MRKNSLNRVDMGIRFIIGTVLSVGFCFAFKLSGVPAIIFADTIGLANMLFTAQKNASNLRKELMDIAGEQSQTLLLSEAVADIEKQLVEVENEHNICEKRLNTLQNNVGLKQTKLGMVNGSILNVQQELYFLSSTGSTPLVYTDGTVDNMPITEPLAKQFQKKVIPVKYAKNKRD